MKKITAALLICLAFACKYQTEKTSGEIKQELKQTMIDFLYKNNHFDSAHVKYEILEVVYTENKDDYVCAFKVHVHDSFKDTTGTMSARISKDMDHVFRRF